jgi:hypothetical protein
MDTNQAMIRLQQTLNDTWDNTLATFHGKAENAHLCFSDLRGLFPWGRFSGVTRTDLVDSYRPCSN